MKDEKYIVFKRDDFDKFLVDMAGSLTPIVGSAMNDLASTAVEDAVVIRRQDQAAPQILEAYSNFYSGAAQVLTEVTQSETGGLTPDVFSAVRRMRGVADYFHQQAAAAWNTEHRKIPD